MLTVMVIGYDIVAGLELIIESSIFCPSTDEYLRCVSARADGDMLGGTHAYFFLYTKNLNE